MQEPTTWVIEFALSTSIELPLAEVERQLPPGLFAKQVRPAVGLMSLTVFRFDDSNERFPGTVHELVLAVHVEPDLALVEAPPNAAMYVLRVVSDDPRFVRDPYAIDRYPTIVDRRFAFALDRDAGRLACDDDTGAPVLELAFRDPGRYVPARELVQSFCLSEGQLYHASTSFEIERAEWQDRSRPAGILHEHPLFEGLDLTRVDMRECFSQKLSAPEEIGLEIYFPARLVPGGPT